MCRCAHEYFIREGVLDGVEVGGNFLITSTKSKKQMCNPLTLSLALTCLELLCCWSLGVEEERGPYAVDGRVPGPELDEGLVPLLLPMARLAVDGLGRTPLFEPL